MSSTNLEKARVRYKAARRSHHEAHDELLEAKIKLMIEEDRFAEAKNELPSPSPPPSPKKVAKKPTKKREKDVEEEQVEAEDDNAAPTKKAVTKAPKQAPDDFVCPGNIAIGSPCEVENSAAYHKQVQNPKTKKLVWACGKCRDQIIAAKKAANAAAKKLAKKQAASEAKTAAVNEDEPIVEAE